MSRAPESLSGARSFFCRVPFRGNFRAMSPTLVTRTYLEMLSPTELRPTTLPDPVPGIEQVEQCSIDFFRFLYQQVGQGHQWTDRLRWSDERVRAHLQNSGVSIWVMTWESGTRRVLRAAGARRSFGRDCVLRLTAPVHWPGLGQVSPHPGGACGVAARSSTSMASYLHPGSSRCAAQLPEKRLSAHPGRGV